jgi:hypothetical protein
LDHSVDPEFGPLWTAAAAWVDVNNDGLLDLVVINYLQWDIKKETLCTFAGGFDYCSPKLYKGQPNQLFLNRGDNFAESFLRVSILAPLVKKISGRPSLL